MTYATFCRLSENDEKTGNENEDSDNDENEDHFYLGL